MRDRVKVYHKVVARNERTKIVAELLALPHVRRATLEDVEDFVGLRLALFREANLLTDALTPGHAADVAEATRRYLERTIPSGAFVCWVAAVEERVVACSGLVMFERLPSAHNLSGREVYILNMYTAPEWRGRGLARTLLDHLIRFARATDTRRIWLHATDAGRPLYEQAGFVAKASEMELTW